LLAIASFGEGVVDGLDSTRCAVPLTSKPESYLWRSASVDLKHLDPRHPAADVLCRPSGTTEEAPNLLTSLQRCALRGKLAAATLLDLTSPDRAGTSWVRRNAAHCPGRLESYQILRTNPLVDPLRRHVSTRLCNGRASLRTTHPKELRQQPSGACRARLWAAGT
jgi:hypothetical protein